MVDKGYIGFFEIPAIPIEKESQDHMAFLSLMTEVRLFRSLSFVFFFFSPFSAFISFDDHKNNEVKRN